MSDARATKLLRVSVATYNRVVFFHPENGILMLALERKATVLKDGSARVRAQPFGGGVRILNPAPLREIVGEISYDSQRSKNEQDLRILMPPSKWEEVKQYCLQHLENPEDTELESPPDRELTEEFAEAISVDLRPEQYTVQPAGFVLEDHPVQTEYAYARGAFTVRVYRIFEVRIVDTELCNLMHAASQRHSDQELARLALEALQNGGGRFKNSILTLPLKRVTESYQALSFEERYRKIKIESHELDESVLAVLAEIDVPQYQRI